MVWARKAGGILLISQLLLTSGGYLVSGKVNDESSETVQSKDELVPESSVQIPEVSHTETTSETGNDGSATNSNERTQASFSQDTSMENHSEEYSSENQSESSRSSTETSESEESLSAQNVEVMASGSGDSSEDPRIVENSDELRKAIEEDKVPFIKLADSSEIFQFEKTSKGRIKISYDVTIDGNGRTLSYSDNGNYYALQVSQANVTVKLKNMTFGSSDYSVLAYDWFGFCYGAGNNNTTIAVENVNYYSNAAAQPFHNDGAGSKIVFSGRNHFSVQRGSYSQEFAECNHFIFEKDSHTTIEHNTGQTNSIATSGNDFTFKLEDGAVVDYTTTSSRFVDNYNGRGNVSIGNGSDLKINGGNKFIDARKSIDFLVEEKGNLYLNFESKFNFEQDSTFHLAKDSTLDMEVTNSNKIFEQVIPTANMTIDNAYRLSFDVSGATNKEPINAGFTFTDFEEGVTGYGITADNQPITTTVATKDTMTSNGTDFTLSNSATGRADFTSDEKTKIRSSRSIVLQRLPNPSVILDVKQTIRDTKATFNLSNYLTNQNQVTGVMYRLFESRQTTSNFETEIDKKVVNDPITSAVDFEGLESEKDYWLYVQIQTNFDTGFSEWYEVPFTTKSSILSVSIPTSMFFDTEMSEDNHLYVHSPGYGIQNNSAYPVDMAMNSFSEDGNSGIELLDTEDPDNKNGLLLQMTLDHEPLTTLKTDLTNVSMGQLAIDEQKKLRFTGEYFGLAGKEINVKYDMTLNFKKAEE